jgi:hypothetical protein
MGSEPLFYCWAYRHRGPNGGQTPVLMPVRDLPTPDWPTVGRPFKLRPLRQVLDDILGRD